MASGWFQMAPFWAEVDNLSLGHTFDVPVGTRVLELARHHAEIVAVALQGDAHVADQAGEHMLSLCR